jgi:hypothetical protein
VKLSGWPEEKLTLFAFATRAGSDDSLASANGKLRADGGADVTLAEIPAGTCVVEVMVRTGFLATATTLWWKREDVLVRADEVVAVEIAGPGAAALGTIAGRIDAAALAGKKVSVSAAGADLTASAEPRADGTFVLQGLPPGDYSVTATLVPLPK